MAQSVTAGVAQLTGKQPWVLMLTAETTQLQSITPDMQ
jgi:hypothetical protein